MSRLFISVERLETWSLEGRATFDGVQMTLTQLGRAFAMRPAVHFTKVIGQDEDANDLVGRVWSKAELEEMGAEQLANSVIFRETAYDVVDGFLGEPLPP